MGKGKHTVNARKAMPGAGLPKASQGQEESEWGCQIAAWAVGRHAETRAITLLKTVCALAGTGETLHFVVLPSCLQVWCSPVHIPVFPFPH